MKLWDIRPRVISSVFALRRFTVPSLCEDSGLDRKQAYPILEGLEAEGFLHSERLQDPKGKAQRPLNLYSLTNKPAQKKKLLDEIYPLLRVAEMAQQELEPESLPQVRKTLNEVASQIEELDREADDRFRSQRNSLRIADIKEKLRSVSSDLELTLIEAGVSKEEVPPTIETEIQRFEKAKAQLHDVVLRVELIQRRLDAEKDTSYALREVAAYSLAQAGESGLDSLYSSALHSCYPLGQQPTWIAAMAEKVKYYLDQSRGTHLSFHLDLGLLEDEYKQTKNPEFKSILSAIDAELTSAFREIGRSGSSTDKSLLFWTLAQLAIRYAGDADTTLFASKLLEANGDANSHVASYNSLNLCLLAGNTEQAFSRWRDLSDECGVRPFRSLSQPSYPGLLLAVMPAALLKQDLLEKFETALGMSCSWSIVSPERLPTVAANPFVVEASLCNPLDMSERIRISDSLRIHAPDFYVYGPIENAVRCPGVPQVALASGLATLGVPRVDAWEFVGGLGRENVLVVVSSSKTVQKPTLHRLGKFLRVLLSAVHKSSSTSALVSTGRNPTAVLAKEGKPVLYDFGTEGAVLKAFAVTEDLAALPEFANE